MATIRCFLAAISLLDPLGLYMSLPTSKCRTKLRRVYTTATFLNCGVCHEGTLQEGLDLRKVSAQCQTPEMVC